MRLLAYPSVLSVSSAVLLAAFARPTADVPRFEPTKGTSVQRTLEMHGARELKTLKLQVGDQEQEVPGASMHQTSTWKHVVVDEFRAVKDGRVTELARTYETLAKSRSETTPGKGGEERTTEAEETCDLAGKVVVFTWKADREAYVPRFESDEGDAKLLEDLVAPMDYEGFLPPAGTEEGGTWKGDFDDLRVALMRPGGDLPFHGEQKPLPLDKRVRAAMWDGLKGEIEFTLGATKQGDDGTRTTIQFKGTYASEARGEREDDEKGPNVLALHGTYEFEGELRWDVDAKRAAGLTWKTKGTLEVRTEMPVQTRDGADTTLVQSMILDDEADYTVSFETP